MRKQLVAGNVRERIETKNKMFSFPNHQYSYGSAGILKYPIVPGDKATYPAAGQPLTPTSCNFLRTAVSWHQRSTIWEEVSQQTPVLGLRSNPYPSTCIRKVFILDQTTEFAVDSMVVIEGSIL